MDFETTDSVSSSRCGGKLLYNTMYLAADEPSDYGLSNFMNVIRFFSMLNYDPTERFYKVIARNQNSTIAIDYIQSSYHAYSATFNSDCIKSEEYYCDSKLTNWDTKEHDKSILQGDQLEYFHKFEAISLDEDTVLNMMYTLLPIHLKDDDMKNDLLYLLSKIGYNISDLLVIQSTIIVRRFNRPETMLRSCSKDLQLIIACLIPMIHALSYGTVMLIDSFDKIKDAARARLLLGLMDDPSVNSQGAQLLLTGSEKMAKLCYLSPEQVVNIH
jgi:hypothetical protein